MLDTSSDNEKLLDRLPVDPIEIRRLVIRGDDELSEDKQQEFGQHFIHVGRVARLVNVRPKLAKTVHLSEAEVNEAALATSARYEVNPQSNLTRRLSQLPLLACEKQGRRFLLDGRQRAAMAFADGVRTVKTYVVPMAQALEAGEVKADKSRFRLYEATRHQPVGVKAGCPHTNTIIMMKGDIDLKREGQRLDNLESGIKDYLLFQTICAVKCFFASALSRPHTIDRRIKQNILFWKGQEQLLLDYWQSAYKLPKAPTWRECANESQKLLQKFTGYPSLPSLTRALTDEYGGKTYQEASAACKEQLRRRNVLLKAYNRAHDYRMYRVALLNLEYTLKTSDQTAIANANDLFQTMPVNGNLRVKPNTSWKERREVRRVASKVDKAAGKMRNPAIVLDFNEQLLLARNYGIDPTLFCFEYTRFSSLFSAYLFAFLSRLKMEIEPSSSLVETYLQRRTLAELAAAAGETPTDLASRLWADLFDFCDPENLLETINLSLLKKYDAQDASDE